MFKEKPGKVDLLYCLSNITGATIGRRNTLVVAIMTTATTIIARLQEPFAINITDGAAFFHVFFFFL